MAQLRSASAMRAYSLIELAVALAIAAIIAGAAVGVYSSLAGSMFGVRAQSRVDTQLQRVARVLVGDLQEIGGGSIRPWHALFVQPTPGQADAVLMLTAESASTACNVVGYAVGAADLQLDPTCNACTVPIVVGVENPYVGRFAVLSMPGSGEGRVVVLRERVVGGGTCRFRADAFIAADTAAVDAALWAGASLTVADARWMFVDQARHELKAWLLYADASSVGNAAPPDPLHAPRGVLTGYVVDERLVASQVHDLQVALGYDVNYDNVIDEAVGGVDDEWFGNAAGEVPATDWIGDNGSEFTSDLVFEPTKAVQQIRLRAATIGLVMGMTARGGDRAAVHVLDGAALAAGNVYYRSTRARAMFRNAGVAQ